MKWLPREFLISLSRAEGFTKQSSVMKRNLIFNLDAYTNSVIAIMKTGMVGRW